MAASSSGGASDRGDEVAAYTSNSDTGSAIITLSNGKQVHASLHIEETGNGWVMSVTGTPVAGAVLCEKLWARHGSKEAGENG